MVNEATKSTIMYSGVSFTSTLGAFIMESLNDIIMWLFVMFFVVIADLVMCIYKILKVRERKIENGIELDTRDVIRVSKGIRDTMGKMATYFAFVVAVIFVGKASEMPYLHKWAMLFVIGGESLSILGNWCKAHGYTFHENKFLSWFSAKNGIDNGIITKDDEQKDSPRRRGARK